jgi:hypothetical protein
MSDTIVYVGYVSPLDGMFHQLLGCVEYNVIASDRVFVRMADAVELEHGKHFDDPAHFPFSVYVANDSKESTENRLLAMPRSAILKPLDDKEAPVYVVCTPSLVGKRVKLNNSLGRVTRDLFRASDKSQSCEVELDGPPQKGEPFYSKYGLWRHYDGSNTHFSISDLSETQAKDMGLLRQRYVHYLRAQLVEKLGGMSRRRVTDILDGGIAFTTLNGYLTPQRQLALENVALKDVGTARFMSMALKEGRVAKDDVIYGRPTKKSLETPHPSGNVTLIWLNTTAYPGLDAFIRWLLMTPEQRDAHDPADAVASTGKGTVFSQLVQGYYTPNGAQRRSNKAFAKMMQRVCWDFEI